ncbi:hypothetical protein DFJ77DRAFT_544879 [Powellomyces hirtus]|nr:hypothetical protein DFJ77DRAFT_544879 [Powellomyces hirtus]
MFNLLSSTWTSLTGEQQATPQRPGTPDSRSVSSYSSSVSSYSSSGSSTPVSDLPDDPLAILTDRDISVAVDLETQLFVEQVLHADDDGFLVPHTIAREYLVNMQPLYLAHTLNSRVEALRHDVLRARLIELVLLLEFSAAYGENAATLTVAPTMDAATRQNLMHAAPVIVDSYPGPTFLPPLTRALYVRLFRSLPIIAGHGDKYLKGVDGFVETEFLDFVGKWMRATKFDILSFSMHYVTLFAHLKNETWYGVDDTPIPVPEGFMGTAPALLPTSMYPDLQTYYRASLPGGGTFRLAKRVRRSPSSSANSPDGSEIEDEDVFEMREFKARLFTDAWRKVLRSGCAICRELVAERKIKMSGDDTPHARFWAVVRTAPTIADLPPHYQSFFYALVTAMSQTVDTILADADWRIKFANIWKRLPVTIMLTSLRLVNPVPFVDRVIKLFCWKPPGMHSLLQRIGGMIAASDKTAAKIKLLQKGLDPQAKSAVERIVDGLFADTVRDESAPHPTRPVSALDSTGKIRTILESHPDAPRGGIATTPHALAYAKLYIRKKEKDEFVESLGGKSVTDFINHLAKIVPPILDEIWNCIDFAALMAVMVETVTRCLAALDLYDTQKPDATQQEKQKLHRDVIHALYAAILPFFKAAYPLLHALANRKSTGPAGLHALVEYLLTEVIDGTVPPTKSTLTSSKATGGQSILAVVRDTTSVTSTLTPHQLDQMWREVDQRVVALEAGVDPRDVSVKHPADIMAGPALRAFWRQIVGEFVGTASMKQKVVTGKTHSQTVPQAPPASVSDLDLDVD